MGDGKPDESIDKRVQELESKFKFMTSWLRSELGYDTESSGNVKRLMSEAHRIAVDNQKILRGDGDKVGMVGKFDVIFRTWQGLLTALALLGGYVLRLLTEG